MLSPLPEVRVDPVLERAIRERRTIRQLDGSSVTRGAIERLLELASMAPSLHNAQPWRFAVVLDPAARERLARQMGMAWRADLERDGVPPPAIAARIEGSYRRMTSAVPIVVCMDRSDLDPYPDQLRRSAECAMAIQSVGAAVQNLLLAAHGMGLGAGWMCAPLFCPELVRSCLGLDARWEPQAMVLVGSPGARPATPPRRPLSEIALFIGDP